MHLACASLPSWFEKKAAIVTPSRLLVNAAVRQFTEHQIASGSQSWQRASIYSVGAWLTACWQQARYSGSNVPALLSPSQERIVWQSIIEEEQAGLFDIASTARLAISASRLISEWQIPTRGDAWNDYADPQHFLRWQQRFRQKCNTEGWISRGDIWRLLPKWISDGLYEPRLTVFAAFERFTPALQQVKNAFGKHAAVEPITKGTPTAEVPAQSCPDFANEIEHAARFARSVLEGNQKKSVAVFVPDLAAHRPLVERTFRKIFYPFAAFHLIRDSSSEQQHSAFHVNASRPLYEYPMIANALLLLQLARPRIAMTDACAILRSPYIAGAVSEKHERAFADLFLRRRRDIDVALRDIESASAGCPGLQTIWAKLRDKLKRGLAHRDLPAWSEFMRDLLAALGWPGEAALTSEELDLVERWKNAVSTLASLGLVSKIVSYDRALTLLRGLLSQDGPEFGDWFSPVQIIDSSEAAALKFDCGFLTGLSEERWPPPLHPSALVPLNVQRAHNIPGASRQSIFEIRQGATESLFSAAPILAATFSGRLSPLAAQSTRMKTEPFTEWRGKMPLDSYTPIALDEIDDSYGPPFASLTTTRGGTGVIRSQSLCPFRGFAEYRLQSTVPEEACFGFDSRDRGQFLHKALQSVWEFLNTQDRLRSTSLEELRTIVREAVLAAVRDDASSPFHRLTTNAERERLENLILEWLEIERSRTHPFTVDSVEQKRSYEISGLRLDLRIDRMDRLQDGSVLLIDYKSGKQTYTKLEGQRPAEPQLLVYAAAIGEPVDGVFFGQLRPRELRAVGFSRDAHFPGRAAIVKKRDWDSFIEQSMANVEDIAAGFVKGNAVVDPIRGACEYCDQKPFCRIREKTSLAGESDLDAD